MEPFNVQNIIDANGFAISATGMTIVFISLALIAGAIAQLPKVLAILDSFMGDKTAAPQPQVSAPAPVVDEKKENEEDEDLMTAIGLVIHMELDRVSVDDKQRITISKHVDQRSSWGAAGKMKTFSRREKYA